MQRLDSLKIIYNLIDYLIHIRDTNLKVKVLSALNHYTTNKHKGFDYSISYKVGDVCWIEFGDNLTPEMALNHMGIIFRKENNQTYFVLPITTPKSSNLLHRNAYHPITNPSGNKRFRRLLQSECNFLAHDSVVKCMEPKLISVKRIISKVGTIQNDSELYKDIVNCTFSYLFAEQSYNMQNIKKENSLLQMTIEASKILDVYNVTAITDLKDLIGISTDMYTFLIGTPVQKDSTQYEVEVKLLDKYNQEIGKIIQYNLITEQI